MNRCKMILYLIFGRCRAKYSRHRNDKWEIEGWGFYSRKDVYLGGITWEHVDDIGRVEVSLLRDNYGFKTIDQMKEEWIEKNPGRMLDES